jgi:hypothetical protein
MKPLRSSIDLAPKAIPVWESIITDLGNPPPHRIAKVLGVSRSTVYRWNAEGGGPRVACLALFWLTRWGHSQIHTQASNDATLYSQLAEALAKDRDRLANQVHELERHHRELAYQLAKTELSPPRLAWPELLPAVAVAPGLATAAPARLAPGAGKERQLSFPLDIEGFRFEDGRTEGNGQGRDGGHVDGLANTLPGRSTAHVEVVPEGHRQQGVQGNTHASRVGTGLSVEGLGESDVKGHGAAIGGEEYQHGTKLAPPALLSPRVTGRGDSRTRPGRGDRTTADCSQPTTPGTPAPAVPAVPAASPGAGRPSPGKNSKSSHQGAQTPAQAPDRPRTRSAPKGGTSRSAGDQMAGRSRPARPGTPASASPAAPATWGQSPHTPSATAPPGRPRSQRSIEKPPKQRTEETQ